MGAENISRDRTQPDFLVAENNLLLAENERLSSKLRDAEARLEAMGRSTSWRLTAPLRALVRLMLQWSLREGSSATPLPPLLPLNAENYLRWLRLVEAQRARRKRDFRNKVARLATQHSISLLMRVKDEAQPLIERAVDSLRAQIYPDWQLVLIDCGSTTPHMARTLATFEQDSRIAIVRVERSVTRGAALDQGLSTASGAFVGVLEPDDVLDDCALAEFALLMSEQTHLAVIYSDEDCIDEHGRRAAPRFKTDWNPDLLLTQPYIGGLSLYLRTLIDQVGGLRDRFSGAEDYDLALRATHSADPATIGHIASVLLHRGGSLETTDGRAEACRVAVTERLRNEAIEVKTNADAGAQISHRIVWANGGATVSVIVPTRDRADLLERCAKGVLASAGANLELLIVDNDSREPRTRTLLSELRTDHRVRILERTGAFNWSAINNEAVRQVSGEVIVFLNNDIEIIEMGWLDELIAQAMRPEVGAVGAKLLYRDDTVQHAGVWLGPHGYARHLLRLSPAQDAGYLGQLATARNLSAITGACLAMRRRVFCELSGFDERLAVEFNDIDLCLRLQQQGYRIVFTPHARLYHLESATRGRPDYSGARDFVSVEHAFFKEKWAERLDRDPFFNPNIDLIGEEVIALRFPPR